MLDGRRRDGRQDRRHSSHGARAFPKRSINFRSSGIGPIEFSRARGHGGFWLGEIVSHASLTEMSTVQPAPHLSGYGLGLYNPADGYALAFGHTGQLPGYMSWAACLPEDGAVIVVLTNHEVDDSRHYTFSHGLARPLVEALRSR